MVRVVSDCPITITAKAIADSKAIFGPKTLSTVRGKTLRRKPGKVRTDCVEIRRGLNLFNKSVTLVADVFFVNGIAFLATLSRRIKFLTVEHITNRTAGRLKDGLNKVCRLYGGALYKVNVILMDMEFDTTTELMPHILVSTAAALESTSPR